MGEGAGLPTALQSWPGACGRGLAGPPQGLCPQDSAPGCVSGMRHSSVAAGGEQCPPPCDGPGRVAGCRVAVSVVQSWPPGLGGTGEGRDPEEPLQRLGPWLVPWALLPPGPQRG